jgi:Fic family protein
MILFGKQKANKRSVQLLTSLLYEMYPANEFTNLETINLYIDDLKQCLESFFPLSKPIADMLMETLVEKFIHHSTAIENNNISKAGVELILKHNQVIPKISLNEHMEIINQKEALDYIKQCLVENKDLSREVLINTHYLILKGIDTKNAGRFRNHEISIYSSEHKPTKAEELEETIYKYFQFYEQNKNSIDPIILAAEMHGKLCFIKPFTDGNGIMARLFMNYILMKDGYPLVNIIGNRENRIKYFQSLESFPTNPKIFYKFIMMSIFSSLVYSVRTVILLAPKYKGKYFYDRLVRKCGVDAREKLESVIPKY